MSHREARVNHMIKNFRHLFAKVSAKNAPICQQQMELSLPGSRLTRDEALFLRNIRRIREQLAASRT
jgi:hypothetical protein